MRRGARVIGLDNSSNQLATARLLQKEFSLRFPLVHADAERPPFADASFDFVISQYGAATWCDPYRWIPEASRILRGGGRLVFETGSPLVMCCYPQTTTMRLRTRGSIETTSACTGSSGEDRARPSKSSSFESGTVTWFDSCARVALRSRT
jgi:ubiquinone/menaquinone biosynthesis C-methylase UbiE